MTEPLQELTPRSRRDPDPDLAIEEWLDFARVIGSPNIQLSAAIHPSQSDVPAEAGLEISAGKMSHLWSGAPISIRLEDLEVICSVLHCQPSELLLRVDPTKAVQKAETVKAAEVSRSVQPSRPRGGCSRPPA